MERCSDVEKGSSEMAVCNNSLGNSVWFGKVPVFVCSDAGRIRSAFSVPLERFVFVGMVVLSDVGSIFLRVLLFVV